MEKPFMAKKITDKIYWVGAIDWSIRNFHGYATHQGTTYNAYLIIDEKITLIDTVKAPFKNEMMSRISSIIEPSNIEIIISNHSEMDHSGCLFETIKEVKPDKVYVSKMGEKALKKHFHIDYPLEVVKSQDKINLGSMNINFLETRMLHWPDSMFSYIPQKKILFSQDAFGMHLAGYERFDTEVEMPILKWEAAKYFANILLPYSSLITNLIKKVEDMGLEFDIIAPDHGPVWTKYINKILNRYKEWALQKPNNKAVVFYDTMWQSTQKMARAIGEGLSSNGTKVKLLSLESSHRSDIATEILDAGAIIVGSPTINNTLFPTLADVLYYLKGLKPINLISGIFGSYGWAPQGIKEIKNILEDMKIEVIDEIKVNYVPTEEELLRCYQMGVKISKAL